MHKPCALDLLLKLTVLLVFLAGSANAQIKKLIEYGWDVPAPSYVAENIRAMEQQPFNGVVMRLLPPQRTVFTKYRYTYSDIQRELNAIRLINWGKFTDNFLVMYCASDMDWFDDSHWTNIASNADLYARAAVAGHCKGLVFDPEPYGENPWYYPVQPQAKTRTFQQYQDIVRRRGAQFMMAIQQTFPNCQFEVLYLLNDFAQRGLVTPPMPFNQTVLQNDGMGLLPSFVYGMLDVVQFGISIHDGNERSYWYTSPNDFTQSYSAIHSMASSLVPADLKTKYQQYICCSQALYVDYLYNLITADICPVPMYSAYMSPAERDQWCEHNIYYGLKTADKYMWVYSEHMDWWKNQHMPSGITNAIISAKKKVDSDAPLGFSMTDIWSRVKAVTPTQ